VTDDRPRPSRRWIRQVGVLSGVGLTLVISTVLGLYGGLALDRWLGTSPWLMLVGLLLGIAAGFLNLFRAVGMFDGDRDRD
jgi:ATP synthase protein I